MGFFNTANQVVMVYGRIVKPGPEFVKNNEVPRPVRPGTGRAHILSRRGRRSIQNGRYANRRRGQRA